VTPNAWCSGVHLRHDERHFGIHAERAGIIHDDCPGLRGERRKLPRNGTARAEQRDVHALECVLGQLLHRDVLAEIRQPLAGRARGREQREFAERKLPLFERLYHFDSDGSGGSDNGDMQVLAHNERARKLAASWRLARCRSAKQWLNLNHEGHEGHEELALDERESL